MLKKIVSMLVLISVVLSQVAQAESVLTFEAEGSLRRVLRPQFSDIEYASPIVLENLRHYVGVDVEDKVGFSPPNHSHLQLWDLNTGHADKPQNYVNLLLQRLFPINMIPNQATKSDPVHHITAEMAGVILNTIVEKPEISADALFAVIDRCFNTQAYKEHDTYCANYLEKWRASGIGLALLRKISPANAPYNLPPGISANSPKGNAIIASQIKSDTKTLDKFLRSLGKEVDLNDTDQTKKLYDDLVAQEEQRLEVKKQEFADKRRRARALIHDFATVIVGALADQQTYAALYPEQTVEAALYTFAQRRVKRSKNQVGEAVQFYKSIPALLKEGAHEKFSSLSEESDAELIAKFGQPYAREDFENLKKELVEKEYVATERRHRYKKPTISNDELRLLLKGSAQFDGMYPKYLPYGTARYIDPSTGKTKEFSDCGEASLLNMFRLLMWDFETKEINLNVLEAIGRVHPKLSAYFKAYPTAKKQESREGRHAWTQVVSNLNGKDIDYAKGADISINETNVCEIIHGSASMAGVLRELLPTNAMMKVNDKADVGERIKQTFDVFFGLFNTEDDAWHWSIKDAKEGQEHSISGNKFLGIEVTKTGKNVPIQNGVPMEGALGTWGLGQGHYATNFPAGDLGDLLTIVSKNRLKNAFLNEKRKLNFAELALMENITFPFEMLKIPSRFLSDGQDEMPSGSYRFDEEISKRLIWQLMVTVDTAQTEFMTYMILFTAMFGVSDMYPMATNFFDLLPCDDPATVAPILSSYVDKDGIFIEMPATLPERFTKRFNSMKRMILDPDFATDCFEYASKGFARHILREINVKSASHKHARLFLQEFLDNNFRLDDWKLLIEKFGDLLKDDVGNINMSKFFISTTENDLVSQPLLSSEQIVEFFNDNQADVLTYLYEELQAIPDQLLLQDFDDIPFVYHLKPEKVQWFLKHVHKGGFIKTNKEAARLLRAMILNDEAKNEKMLEAFNVFLQLFGNFFPESGEGSLVWHLQKETDMVRPQGADEKEDKLLVNLTCFCHPKVIKKLMEESKMTLRQVLDVYGSSAYVGGGDVIESVDMRNLSNKDFVHTLNILAAYKTGNITSKCFSEVIKRLAESFLSEGEKVDWKKFRAITVNGEESVKTILEGCESEEALEWLFDEGVLGLSDYESTETLTGRDEEVKKIMLPYQGALRKFLVKKYLSGTPSDEYVTAILQSLSVHYFDDTSIIEEALGLLKIESAANRRTAFNQLFQDLGVNRYVWLTSVLAYWTEKPIQCLIDRGLITQEDLVATYADPSTVFTNVLGLVCMSANTNRFHYLCSIANADARKKMAENRYTLSSLLSAGSTTTDQDGVTTIQFTLENFKGVADMLSFQKEDILSLDGAFLNASLDTLLEGVPCCQQRLRDIIEHFGLTAEELFEKMNTDNKEKAKKLLPDLFCGH